MTKIKESGHFFTFASKFFRYCFVVIAVGPIRHVTVAGPIVQSITKPVYKSLNSPFWTQKSGCLYFVDETSKLLIKYQPGAKQEVVSAIFQPETTLKFLVPVSGKTSTFVAGYGSGVGLFTWDGIPNSTILLHNYISICTHPTEAVECGKADVRGRLWIGTSYWAYDEKQKYKNRPREQNKKSGLLKGKLYMVEKDGTVYEKADLWGAPNGIAWNSNNTVLYYSNPTENTIVELAYNVDTANIAGKGKAVFNFVTNNITGVPSGITVDDQGHIWVANSHTSQVVKINLNNGVVSMKVHLPGANSITSIAFGSLSLGDLYVTSTNALFRVTGTGSAGYGVSDVLVSKWPKKTSPI